MLYDLSELLMNTQENRLQHFQTKFNGSSNKISLWWCLILWYICTKFWENNEFKKEYQWKKCKQKITILVIAGSLIETLYTRGSKSEVLLNEMFSNIENERQH